MKTRIKTLIQKEQMSSSQFAEEIGISPSSLHHIVNGRNNPSLEVIQKILSRFKYINANWFITGEGNPYKKIEQTSLFPEMDIINEEEPINEENKTKNDGQKNMIKPPVSEISAIELGKNKFIDKILLLYSDGSFSVYEK